MNRPPDLRGSMRSPGELQAQEVRTAWLAVMRVRKAVQARIVEAFRRQLEGRGPGPSDGDLLLFARLAVSEQRLMHRAA